MTIQALFFAVLRDALTTSRLDATLPDGATGTDLLDRLADEHPEVARYRGVVRLAVNGRYVPEATTLADGDEVALITPVSGG